MSRIAAVILAAGASARMGTPKSELEWDGSTFLDLVCRLALESQCEPVVLVWGAVELKPPAGIRPVRNPRWQRGQLSSLQVGVRSATKTDSDLRGLAVLTIDRPRVRLDTLARLRAAFLDEPNCIWQPHFQGRSGHPILYPAAVVPELLRLPDTATARDIVRSQTWRSRRRKLVVEDPGVVDNIDTPADHDRLD